MAATAVAPTVFNLNTQATFPLRLGSSILKPAESKSFTSVRYNHKPLFEGSEDVTGAIKTQKSNNKGGLELNLKDGDKEYAYQGKNVGDGDRYVLLSKRKGKDMEFVLEKLEACREFNVIRTPGETSADKLERKYPQLPEDDGREEELFGDGDTDEKDLPDIKNAFDYRNYLKEGTARPKDVAVGGLQSGANTPLAQPRPASTTPHSRPSKRTDGPLVAQKKRKAQDATKANPKRVKAGTEPPAPESTAAPTRKDIPRLRMDRKASVQIQPFQDSGDLILENETPTQEKPRGAMALALAGQFAKGPISLHSAASSPASRAVSPMPPRPGHVEEGEEFELGESSPDAPKKRTAVDNGNDNEADEDADADVEDLELPSPAQTHRQAQRWTEDVTEDKLGGDDDDDLDMQLARAMAEEDDGEAAPPARPAESDEESEEE